MNKKYIVTKPRTQHPLHDVDDLMEELDTIVHKDIQQGILSQPSNHEATDGRPLSTKQVFTRHVRLESVRHSIDFDDTHINLRAHVFFSETPKNEQPKPPFHDTPPFVGATTYRR